MTYELFEQGPGVYIPLLLVSILITAVSYAAYPLLLARFRRKPITVRRYRVYCYLFNILVMVFFTALNGSSSGAPYVLWTSVFCHFGKNTLVRRSILVDPEDTVSDRSSAPSDTDLEYTGKFQQTTDFVPAPANQQNSKPRFCKHCGSPIDPATKKCAGCGKQYFRLPARKKNGLVLKLVTVLSVIAVCLCVYRISQLEAQFSNQQTYIAEQDAKIAELKESEESLQRKNKELSSSVASLKGKNSTLTKENQRMERVYNFCNDHVVVVSDDGTRTYHKIGCFYFDDSYFWAYNTEKAEQLGYSPCSFCFSRYFESLMN